MAAEAEPIGYGQCRVGNGGLSKYPGGGFAGGDGFLTGGIDGATLAAFAVPVGVNSDYLFRFFCSSEMSISIVTSM